MLLSSVVACSTFGDNIVEIGVDASSADGYAFKNTGGYGDDPASPADPPGARPRPGGRADDGGSGTSPEPGDDPGQPGCQPSCFGKQCGHDGCGGSCGTCMPGRECDAVGLCQCIPSCAGKTCGTDGCGGSCGECAPGSSCEGGVCACQPNCFGKQCGDDGCGGSCGGCPGYAICQGELCICQPSCAGKQCGSDGCNGTCGSCGTGKVCSGGSCVCQPQCSGKQCGPDGCGGTCGSCQGFQACKSNSCVGWKWEVESDGAIGHEQGKKESNGWACNTGEHSKNFMVYGPYIQNVPAGAWKAVFRMMIDNNTAGNDKVVRLEAYDFASDTLLASQWVKRMQFAKTFDYQDFPVVFQKGSGGKLEFRVFWEDTAWIKVDRVTLLP